MPWLGRPTSYTSRVDQAATVVGIGLGKRAPLVIDIATRLLDLGEHGQLNENSLGMQRATENP